MTRAFVALDLMTHRDTQAERPRRDGLAHGHGQAEGGEVSHVVQRRGRPGGPVCGGAGEGGTVRQGPAEAGGCGGGGATAAAERGDANVVGSEVLPPSPLDD